MIAQIIVDHFLLSRDSREINSGCKLVLICLAARISNSNRCYSSYSHICSYTSLSRNTVIRSLKLLEDKKIIKIVKQVGESSYYELSQSLKETYECSLRTENSIHNRCHGGKGVKICLMQK